MNPRRATVEDVPALVRVINLAYRVEDFFINGDRTTAEEVHTRLASPHAAFLVMDGPVPGELAGAVFVDVKGDRGYFGMLSVDPAQQKRGLGLALVNAVENHCRAAGCRALDIDVVNLREELPAFYRRLGFAPVGTGPFPTPAKLSRPAHLILMSKTLGDDQARIV